MFEAFMLTPLMLAAEPVSINIPEQTYDHRTQTSTYKGLEGLNRMAATIRSSKCSRGGGGPCGDISYDFD
jgi:hypothetical protein